jgi:glycosyltransferase involved in cell wall biosynthesis
MPQNVLKKTELLFLRIFAMAYNIRIISTYPPRRCGIGTFARDLASALEHFTGEVGSIRIAAIDKDQLPYSIPVDLVIDQYDPQSWKYAIKDIIARAAESPNKTIILLQHEYGLDPDENSNDGDGTNFLQMTKAFTEKGLTTLVYLHTVLDNPDSHQKMVLQELAQFSDGLIVTTESAVNILQSKIYCIEHSKLKHIDHGIRMQHPSQYDRFTIKVELGLKDMLLATTVGLLSTDKGIQYSIRGFGKFLNESCTQSQREKIVYLIAGQFHPEFVKSDNGKCYQNFMEEIDRALKESDISWCRTKDLQDVDFSKYDVVFLDTFLDEVLLLQLYTATNMMILPYLNMQQMSSGVLADTVGSGRVAISTKFQYARELIHSNKKCQAGLVIGRHARGILVDPGENSVDQIAQAIDYLTFYKKARLRMEKQALQRGFQMRWYNSAWALLQHTDFVRSQNERVCGRGITFQREKKSIFQK